MIKRLFVLGALLAGTLMGVAGATSGERPGTGHQPLIVKGSTKTPIGARQFCAARPDDCTPPAGPPGPLSYSSALKRDLVDVNRRFNTEVVAITDQDYYKQRELWTYPDGYGDCEDFALAKRRELMQRGWPASSLLMTMVRQRNGDAHAVLVAVTDSGDFVLDNLADDVLDWDETNYKFVKMQTPDSMNKWVDIKDDRVLGVASK